MVHCPAGKLVTSIRGFLMRQRLEAVDNHALRSFLRAVAATSIALMLGTLTACSGGDTGASPTKTIVIGADLPLTGVEGAAGLSTLNGVRFFVHSHPTLDGFNITIDARDDPFSAARDTARGVSNVQALIAQAQVLAMIGPFDANVARAQIPIANLAHLALVSPGTSSRCLTKVPFLPSALNPARTEISCKMAGRVEGGRQEWNFGQA